MTAYRKFPMVRGKAVDEILNVLNERGINTVYTFDLIPTCERLETIYTNHLDAETVFRMCASGASMRVILDNGQRATLWTSDDALSGIISYAP